MNGQNDRLVKAGVLLERSGNWNEFLMGGLNEKELEVIRCHTHTGKSPGEEKFIRQIELAMERILGPLKRGG